MNLFHLFESKSLFQMGELENFTLLKIKKTNIKHYIIGYSSLMAEQY